MRRVVSFVFKAVSRGLAVLLAVAGLLILAEICLAPWVHAPRLKERVIRLREHRPHTHRVIPAASALSQNAPGLERDRTVLETDANGFILPGSGTSDAFDARILFLGGSTTESLWVRPDLRFPYAAGQELEKRLGLRIAVWNSGVSGNHSVLSLDILFHKGIPLKPDLAVFCHNFNDVVILLLEGSYWNRHPYRSLIIDDVLGEGPFWLRALRDRVFPNLFTVLERWSPVRDSLSRYDLGRWDEFAGRRGNWIRPDEERLRAEFRKSLLTYTGLCRIHGIRPVLMTEASLMTGNPQPRVKEAFMPLFRDYGIRYEDFFRIFEVFNEEIREVARLEQVPLIDLDRQLPKEERYFADFLHFNDAGSVLASGIVSDGLQELMQP